MPCRRKNSSIFSLPDTPEERRRGAFFSDRIPMSVWPNGEVIASLMSSVAISLNLMSRSRSQEGWWLVVNVLNGFRQNLVAESQIPQCHPRSDRVHPQSLANFQASRLGAA